MNKTPVFVLLGLMTVNAFGADTGVFSYRVGRFDVYTLVENRRQYFWATTATAGLKTWRRCAS